MLVLNVIVLGWNSNLLLLRPACLRDRRRLRVLCLRRPLSPTNRCFIVLHLKDLYPLNLPPHSTMGQILTMPLHRLFRQTNVQQRPFPPHHSLSSSIQLPLYRYRRSCLPLNGRHCEAKNLHPIQRTGIRLGTRIPLQPSHGTWVQQTTSLSTRRSQSLVIRRVGFGL